MYHLRVMISDKLKYGRLKKKIKIKIKKKLNVYQNLPTRVYFCQ